MPQVRVEATDLIMVKVEADNFEGLHHEIEVKDLSIVSISFKFCTQYGNAHKPYFQGNQINTYRGQGHGRGPQHFRGCIRGRANYQNNTGMYQYQYYRHDQQSEQYGPPCSSCSRFNHSPKHCYKGEHDINNIMEKIEY